MKWLPIGICIPRDRTDSRGESELPRHLSFLYGKQVVDVMAYFGCCTAGTFLTLFYPQEWRRVSLLPILSSTSSSLANCNAPPKYSQLWTGRDSGRVKNDIPAGIFNLISPTNELILSPARPLLPGGRASPHPYPPATSKLSFWKINPHLGDNSTRSTPLTAAATPRTSSTYVS